MSKKIENRKKQACAILSGNSSANEIKLESLRLTRQEIKWKISHCKQNNSYMHMNLERSPLKGQCPKQLGEKTSLGRRGKSCHLHLSWGSGIQASKLPGLCLQPWALLHKAMPWIWAPSSMQWAAYSYCFFVDGNSSVSILCLLQICGKWDSHKHKQL